MTAFKTDSVSLLALLFCELHDKYCDTELFLLRLMAYSFIIYCFPALLGFNISETSINLI